MAAQSTPEELRYTEDHEWVAERGDGVVRVGITEYAQDQLGDVVFVDLPDPGGETAAGETVGEVESTKSVSEIYAPLDGEIVAVNAAVVATPELINGDPYGEGWLVELEVSDPATLDGLLDAEAYQRLTGS
ncbi:glycine cleavage system protein GcvH [Prauserella halophila]|uniref:Glycine cleavage system H protein n=1 Tax=Prauserella halophila TaxID=185641 RepID=A0ABN1WK29_9PSEU|nr:glycine cleavage system protein GcvH [Prauserella halophila]MCP2237143.1 glycine cleavage system H protein [Prauserella halophila]